MASDLSIEQQRALALARARRRRQKGNSSTDRRQEARRELARRELMRRKEQALIAADKAGDEQGARVLADSIREDRAALNQQQPTDAGSASMPWNNFATPQIGYGAKEQAMQAMTLGTADNILAGAMTPVELIKGALSGEDTGKGFTDRVSDAYSRTVVPYQQGLQDYQRDNPGRSLAANLAGGTILGGGMASSGLTATSLVPKALTGAKAKAATGGALVADGTALGGLYAFNEGQDVGEGALLGAAGGAVGAIAAPALQGASRLIADAARTFKANPNVSAARTLAEALRQSGLDEQAIRQRINDLGAEGFLVDTMGATGEGLARTVSNVSPVARETLETASIGRQAGQSERLAETLENAAGLQTRQTPEQVATAIRDDAAPGIAAAYDKAREAGFGFDTGKLDPLMQSQGVSEAMQQGAQLARERMIAQGQTGNPSQLAIVDEAKKLLDAQAVPDLGKPANNQQAIAAMLAGRLRSTADEAVPEYGGARQMAQDAARMQEAVGLGAEGARGKVPLDYAERIASMPQQADAIAKGYASAQVGNLMNARATPGVTERLFGSPQQMAAMRAALGDQAEQMTHQLGRERTFNTTHRALTGNSSTVRQISDLIRHGAAAPIGGAGIGAGYGAYSGEGAIQGAIAGAALGAGGRMAGRRVQTARAARQAEMAPELARMLIGRNVPGDVTGIFDDREQLAAAIRQMLTAGPVSQVQAVR